MKTLKDYLAESETWMHTPAEGDAFGIELADGTLIESYIFETADDSILLDATAEIVSVLESWNLLGDQESDDAVILETMGYGTLVGEQDDEMDEAKYHGREVPLGKPMKGDVKKSKVYVRDPATGNIKKVNFGDPNMRIKKTSPAHRKSFRARHHCENPGPRTRARYWSCRAW
jgi:hypothetical protein